MLILIAFSSKNDNNLSIFLSFFFNFKKESTSIREEKDSSNTLASQMMVIEM